MVEVNLFKKMADPCPANWDDLVRLYRTIYDTVRPQVESRTKVFTTLTLQQPIGYDAKIFHSPLAFETCAGDPNPPAYVTPVPEKCYPLDQSAISDLVFWIPIRTACSTASHTWDCMMSKGRPKRGLRRAG
jgi:hypothetical protein